MPSSRSSFTVRRFRRSARSSSLLGSVATVEDVKDLFVATEKAYVLRLDVALKRVLASSASSELSPIADRLQEILEFHERVLLPSLEGASVHEFQRFFVERSPQIATLYRSFFALEVQESVADSVVQLRPHLRVLDEQLTAYVFLFAALHRVSSAGRRVEIVSASPASESAGHRVEVFSASSESESAGLRVEVLSASSKLLCFDGRRRLRLKQRSFLRATERCSFRADQAQAPRKPFDLGKKYDLHQPWKAISHEQCEQDLGMRVPRILKVKDTCTYVAVAFACASLGQDFIDMLARAIAVPGSRKLTAANRLIATTLRALILSPVPISVHAFREAAKVDEGSDGAYPRDVMLKVLKALRHKDQERFTVRIDTAFVCPHCGRHGSNTRSVPRPFFDYHRQDYDYTEPWADVCGLPFEDFGAARCERAPQRKDSCKCGEQLRSTRQDGTLDVKEKLMHPEHAGKPQEPQYVVVFYECPPAIVKNGERMADVAKMKDMKVRPHLQQRFGAYRLSPYDKVQRGTVFDTKRQEVFHLVGYAPIIPQVFNHVAWRAHNLVTGRFIHSEVKLRYFQMGQQDYLADQQISFAIYKSTGEHVSEQPRRHEDKWAQLNVDYATHKTEKEAPEGVKTRSQKSQASKTAQVIDEPGPSGTHRQASTVEDSAQPGPSGLQQRAVSVDVSEQPGPSGVQQAQKVAKKAQKKTAKRGK